MTEEVWQQAVAVTEGVWQQAVVVTEGVWQYVHAVTDTVIDADPYIRTLFRRILASGHFDESDVSASRHP